MSRRNPIAVTIYVGTLLLAASIARPAGASTVSFSRDVQTILNQNCISCHRPEKRKGKLDLTSFAAIDAGGKNGEIIVSGEPKESALVTMVSGDHPEMPSKGDPLTAVQVNLLTRWVAEGAANDTPAAAATATGSGRAERPPVYAVAPMISAIAWSRDGGTLIVGGYHEVLLHHADGSGLIARLPSHAAKITSLAFSIDGSQLLAAGGLPGGAGQIDVWHWQDRQLTHDFMIPGGDTLFGANFSRDGSRIAFGCADRTVRVISARDGKEKFRFDAHSDWALGAAFTLDGSRVASAGRDKNLKTFPIASTQPADDVNDAIDPFTCLVRHPTQDWVACGCANGSTRIYHITGLLQRTDQKRDPNLVKQLDQRPGPVNAVAFSADGKRLATAGVKDVLVYQQEDWKKIASLTGFDGPVFAVAFSPDGLHLATAGYDGKVRIFDLATQKLQESFVPVPLMSPTTGPAR
jgi:mono/diheme cytochrome c family protein